MPSIDDRIVSMKFDNQQFERQVDSTIKSLNDLKQNLNFSNVKTSLSDIANIDKGLSLDTLSGAVSSISDKFTLLNGVAFAALTNITNKAITMGESLAKSLSLDQVLSGYREYETNIGSIQTILANTQSKGSTLQDVNKALDELNTYSDQTIYNFGQMTKNIGTFTAAGVSLDTSVASIKGFSNVAAISGSTAEQASMGMYQLSQALAAGQVRLIDWKSIQNAGMGGELFQKSLFETGKALGKLKGVNLNTTFDQWKKSQGSFNASLEKGWLTADVMTTTLQAFTGDLTQAQLVALGYSKEQAAEMEKLGKLGKSAATNVKTLSQLLSTLKEAVGSGWSATFRTIFGDFEEAKALFSGWYSALSAIVSKQADARNKILGDWKALGGRAELIAGITILFHDFGLAIAPIRQAFRELFPRKTGKDLYNLTVTFRQFAEKLAMSAETAVKVKMIFRGIFAVVKLTIGVFKVLYSFASAVFKLFASPALGTAFTGISKLANGFSRFATDSNAVLLEVERRLVRFFQMLSKFKEVAGVALTKAKDAFVNFYKAILPYVSAAAVKMGAFFSEVGQDIKYLYNIVANFLVKAFQKVQGLFSQTEKTGQGTKNTVKEASTSFSTFKKVLDAVGATFDKLHSFFVSLREGLVSTSKTVGQVIGNLFNGINEVFSSKTFSSILRIFEVGFLGSLVIMMKTFIKGGWLDFFGGQGLSRSIRQLIESVTGSFKVLQTELKADALMRIAKAIAILTVSLVVISMINAGDLVGALFVTATGLAQLVGTLALLDKIKTDNGGYAKFVALSTSMAILGASLILLAISLRIISKLSWNSILKGMAMIRFSLAALAKTLKSFQADVSPREILAGAVAIWAFGGAIGKLAKATKLLGEIPFGQLIKGLVGLKLILKMLTTFITNLPTTSEKKLKGIFALSIAIRILASAIKVLGQMGIWDLFKGLFAFNIILITLEDTLTSLNKVDISKVAVGLLALSFAITVITGAIVILSFLSGGSLAKAILALAVTLGILVGAVEILGKMKETDTASLAILAAAMLLLALAFKTIAALSVGNIIAGLVAIGGALTILIIAAAAAGEVIPGLLALGGAILLIGGGFALIGVGALLFASAFEIFAKYGSQAIDVAKKLVMAMAGLIPTIAEGFAAGFISLAEGILDQLPDLIKKFVVVAAEALKGLTALLPDITKFVGAAIDSILTLFKDKSPAIITAGIEFILNLLDGIRKNTDKVTKLGADIIIDFINGLRTKVGGIVIAAADLLIAFLNGVAQKLPDIIASGTALVVNFLNGVAAAITPIAEAAANLVVALLEGIASYITDVSTAGADLIISFIEGIGSNGLRIVESAFNTVITFLEGLASSIRTNRSQLVQAGLDVLGAIFEGVTTALVDLKNWFLGLGGKVLGWIGDAASWLLDVGKNIIEGLWNGIIGAKDWFINKLGDWLDWLPGWVKSILGIESPSKVFAEIGHYVTLGMAEGVSSNKARLALRTSAEAVADEVVKSFAPDQKQITETAQKSFENSLKQISLADMSIDATPVIAPVLDLTNIQKDSSKISTMLGATPLTANVSAQQASSLVIATATQQDAQTVQQPTVTEVKFEQNVYAPTALSVGDIYRQTKNQITMAKEELSIL